MRLRCIRRTSHVGTLTIQAIGRSLRTEHDLVVGREYVAMGLTVTDGAVWIDVATDGGFLMPVPLTEFQIVSGKLSTLWDARVDGDGTVRFWPPSFFTPFYHSDLADREPAVVADFDRIRRQIEDEDRRGGLRTI